MIGRDPKRRAYLTETFESEAPDRTTSRFMMDRTLYKGIKENDVSKIIDIGNEGGTLGEKQLPSEEQQLENIVVQMRKKYDEVKNQTAYLQAEIEKNRKAAELLKSQQNTLTDHITSTRTTYEKTQKQFQTMSFVLQARIYDLDIYKQMLTRLKKDILVMKKRNFDQDSFLKKDKIKLKTLRQEDFNKNKLSYKCRDMLQSIQRAVTSKQNQRNNKINTFYDALNRRHQNIIKREQREKEIEEVTMKAMSQKLQQEKEWINICLVNTFFKKFLKNKMQILIQNNQEIESAYHQIRSNTDIKDCKDLITRFLGRQRDYGQLLQRISEKEHKLEDLKQKKEILQKTHQELEQQEDQLHDSVQKGIADFGPLQKEIDIIENNLKLIQEKSQLMNKWAIRFFCSFTGKTKEQIQNKYASKTLKDMAIDVLSEISKYTDRILGDENCSDNINNAFMSTRPSAKIFEDEMLYRNKRVKTTVADDSVNEAEDKEAYYDGHSEADFLQYNRKLTKKNDLARRFRIKTQLK